MLARLLSSTSAARTTHKNGDVGGPSAAALALPSIVLYGSDAGANLRAAESVAGGVVPTGKYESVEVPLPAADWGPGRRVAVERRFATNGTLFVYAPELSHAADGSVHESRCAGVLELCNEAAGGWNVDMKRRVIVLHGACRLGKPCLNALCKLIESTSDRSLFLLTCSRLSAIGHRLISRAFAAHVPPASSCVPQVKASVAVDAPRQSPISAHRLAGVVSALASGRMTPLDAVRWASGALSSTKATAEDDDRAAASFAQVVRACAHADHRLSAIVARSGGASDLLHAGRAAAARTVEAALAVAFADPCTQRQRQRNPNPNPSLNQQKRRTATSAPPPVN